MMTIRSQSRGAVLIAGTLAMGMLGLATPRAAAQPDSSIRLEGTGKHRADCDAMQLKPFDFGTLSGLSQWSGEAPTAESTKDKVVLLFTWAGWNKQTFSAVKLAQQLHTANSGKGLVVVGIHNPRAFDSAAKAATDFGVTFPYAADEQGKIRSALNIDNDPDFLIVDRSGNMRFADVETTSVQQAVEMLLRESPEQAAAVPGDLAKASKAREIAAMRTTDTRGLVKPGQPLTVTFPEPSEEAYQNTDWPNFFDNTNFQEYDTIAQKLKKDKPEVELPDETWLTPRPVSKGRITVIYLFDPLKEDMLGQITLMNRAQDAYRRDAVMIGVAIADTERRDRLTTEEEKQKYDRDVAKGAEQIVKYRELNHAIVVGQFKVADITKWATPLKSMREFGICLILSSDNKVRWYGNPFFEGFRPALDQMVRVDPAAIARRKAEDLKASIEGR